MKTIKTMLLLCGIGFLGMDLGCSMSPEKASTPKSDAKYATVYDVFSRHDTNSDGYLDRHEFLQFQQDPEISKIRTRIAENGHANPLLFEEIDEDHDERISLNEMTVIAESYIPKIQQDK